MKKKSPPPVDLTPEVESEPEAVDLTAEQGERVPDIRMEKLPQPQYGVSISIKPKKREDVEQ